MTMAMLAGKVLVIWTPHTTTSACFTWKEPANSAHTYRPLGSLGFPFGVSRIPALGRRDILPHRTRTEPRDWPGRDHCLKAKCRKSLNVRPASFCRPALVSLVKIRGKDRKEYMTVLAVVWAGRTADLQGSNCRRHGAYI